MPLQDLLVRLSRQLHHMHLSGQKIEDVVGDLIQHGQGSAHAFSAPLQGLDQLVQQIEALSGFLRDLAPGVAPDLVVDPAIAAQGVRLRELVSALTGPASPMPEAKDDAIQFF